jgi:hypothetical protein
MFLGIHISGEERANLATMRTTVESRVPLSYDCVVSSSFNGSVVESKARVGGCGYTCGYISPHCTHTLLRRLLEIKPKTMKASVFCLDLRVVHG